MSNLDPSSRVQLTLDPALPSKCIVCDRSSNGLLQFVDFNLNFDYYGAVVFCEDCIRECLNVVDNEAIAKLESELASTKAKLEVADGKLRTYAAAFDNVTLIRPDLNPVGDDDDIQSEGPSEADEPTEERVLEVVGEGEDDESDSNGSDSVGGLENFSIFTNQ